METTIRIIIKQGKWIFGKDSIHLVLDINGRDFYTDVKSTGTNFTLVEDLEIKEVNIPILIIDTNYDNLKAIEDTKWPNDLELVNSLTKVSYSIQDYKNKIV